MSGPLFTQAPNQFRSSAAKPCRVAIAGTVTNAATGDVMPQAVVRITAAPAAFVEGLMALLVAAIAHRPALQAHYSDLIERWNQTLAPLATAQLLLDRLEHALALVRPDQTWSGGDGHYCFFDLPPGQYTLTATYTLPNQCHGMTSMPVNIVQSDRRLTFAAADIAIRLVPGSCPLVLGSDPLLPAQPTRAAAQPAAIEPRSPERSQIDSVRAVTVGNSAR
ncbi:hypothetical protein [Leptolyngbya sp. KIOST-1]|uniref:hypothetical protein n=1 Tax=Leptolyngbya sp. KIOST-1 TaxID=1229172 RepID=UPI0012E00CB5|nr:hypothetical protein [Leptolyngbya sp. KIOST-1]